MRDARGEAWNLTVALRAPLAVTSVVLAYSVANKLGVVPSPEQLSASLLEFFTQHGALVVAPICFFENFAPFNAWFPGALAILTAMSSTSGNLSAAIQMFFVIWLSSLLGLVASFFVSRFLSSRGRPVETELDSMSRARMWALSFVVFFHPYVGSLNVFRMGAAGSPFKTVCRPVFVSHLVWSIFWGVTTYRYGLWLYSGDGLLIFIWVYLAIWTAIAVLKHYRFM